MIKIIRQLPRIRNRIIHVLQTKAQPPLFVRELISRFDIERLRRATIQLTSAQQEVISLRFAGGLAIAEVARTMGKSEGAVKALQHSAVAALRKVLLVSEESEER